MTSMEYNKKSRKLVIIILIDVLIIAILAIYFGILRMHNNFNINGIYISEPSEIADLHFTDNHGLPFSKKNLQGHWTMIFFGFTNCATVCPTTMAELDSMYQILQQKLPENELPHVVFISVDPERDTIDNLNRFVNLFNSKFIGIRADRTETISLEKQFHITVSSNNTITHSLEILLLNPEVRVQTYFSYPHHAKQMADDYIKILAKTIPSAKYGNQG